MDRHDRRRGWSAMLGVRLAAAVLTRLVLHVFVPGAGHHPLLITVSLVIGAALVGSVK